MPSRRYIKSHVVYALSFYRITTIKKSECATERDMHNILLVKINDHYDEYGGGNTLRLIIFLRFYAMIIIHELNNGLYSSGHLSRPLGSALSPLNNLRELRLNGNPIASLCMDEFLNMENLKARYRNVE